MMHYQQYKLLQHGLTHPLNPQRQGGTDTLWTRVGFCVTMGQKLRNVPSNSLLFGVQN
jgi:hypothetical protein